MILKNLQRILIQKLKKYYQNQLKSVLKIIIISEVTRLKNSISKIISKCIPVNEELEIVVDEEITKEVNLWFYPICYEVTINNKTYRVLKVDNKSNENSIIKVKADGMLEVRID